MTPIYLDVQFVRSQIERLLLDFPELSEDAELLTDSLEGETGLHEILTRLVRQERDAAAFSEAIKAQEEALSDRRARFVKQQQMFRQLMLTLLDTAGQQKVALPEATLSVSKGRLKTVITDEASLPPDYLKVKTCPDLTRIGAALASGVHVPGASIGNGSTTLAIRVK